MTNRVVSLRLLPPAELLKTGTFDHAGWNYRPLLGAISRARFNLAVRLLSKQRVERLLEVGYGSGIFLPELSRWCKELYGIDPHELSGPVSETLAALNIDAQLFSGSATAMPFANGFFDRVVAVSSLEFVEDLDACCVELRRVLKPGGSLVLVTPGHSPLIDFGLRVLTGESAKADYGERRHSLISTLLSHFAIERSLKLPAVGSSLIHLYTGLRLV